jgi:glycosyltransferase involved in cell wall biosynthesis
MGGDNLADHQAVFHQKIQTPLYKSILKKIIPRSIWTTLNNHKLLLHDKAAGRRLEESILKHQPDLIYERSEYLQDSGAQMANKYGIRYFLEVNAPFVEEMRHFEGYSLYQDKAHKVEKYKLDNAWKVFSVSSALSAFLIERYGCDEKKIILQPNCINLDHLKTLNPNKEALKKDLNIGSEKVIGFVGSIFPYHGVDMLIKAFTKVFRENGHIKLLIIGDGTIVPELKRLAQNLKVDDNVLFAGKIPHKEVFSYMNIMDICVMAKSNWYGSPVKIFEYGLMNKPIIAPDTVPVRDVMVHNESGLIVRDDVDELAEAIQTYLANNEFSMTCARSFHEKVIHQYTWQKAAERIIRECV